LKFKNIIGAGQKYSFLKNTFTISNIYSVIENL